MERNASILAYKILFIFHFSLKFTSEYHPNDHFVLYLSFYLQ